jgi:hypothetical protein
MNKKNKDFSICVRISKEENKMVETLRDKHCVNISKFIRKFIKETYGNMENKHE